MPLYLNPNGIAEGAIGARDSPERQVAARRQATVVEAAGRGIEHHRPGVAGDPPGNAGRHGGIRVEVRRGGSSAGIWWSIEGQPRWKQSKRTQRWRAWSKRNGNGHGGRDAAPARHASAAFRSNASNPGIEVPLLLNPDIVGPPSTILRGSQGQRIGGTGVCLLIRAVVDRHDSAKRLRVAGRIPDFHHERDVADPGTGYVAKRHPTAREQTGGARDGADGR
jgi:hypothetical protein